MKQLQRIHNAGLIDEISRELSTELERILGFLGITCVLFRLRGLSSQYSMHRNPLHVTPIKFITISRDFVLNAQH